VDFLIYLFNLQMSDLPDSKRSKYTESHSTDRPDRKPWWMQQEHKEHKEHRKSDKSDKSDRNPSRDNWQTMRNQQEQYFARAQPVGNEISAQSQNSQTNIDDTEELELEVTKNDEDDERKRLEILRAKRKQIMAKFSLGSSSPQVATTPLQVASPISGGMTSHHSRSEDGDGDADVGEDVADFPAEDLGFAADAAGTNYKIHQLTSLTTPPRPPNSDNSYNRG